MKVDVIRLLDALGVEATDRGGELWACCPYPGHEEGEASWSIRNDVDSTKHGLHRCFGCKRGGTPADLVSAMLNISVAGAIRWIDERGLNLGRECIGLPELRISFARKAIAATTLPKLVKQSRWDAWPQAAMGYIEGRGFGPQHVLRYGLGYCASGRLAGRIVLPAYDADFNVTTYTARSYRGSSKRYLNPAKGDGYPHKRAIFGEHLWGQYGSDIVFTSEGALNAMAISDALADAHPVAGLFGSELHAPQMLKLRRFKRIVHVADSDPTGEEFARRLSDAMGSVCEVRVVWLADGDACDCERDALRELCDEQA
jgi:DNA primase